MALGVASAISPSFTSFDCEVHMMDTNSVRSGDGTPDVRELARSLDCIEDAELQAAGRRFASKS
jgi:hypothetical protein